MSGLKFIGVDHVGFRRTEINQLDHLGNELPCQGAIVWQSPATGMWVTEVASENCGVYPLRSEAIKRAVRLLTDGMPFVVNEENNYVEQENPRIYEGERYPMVDPGEWFLVRP